MRFGDLLHLAAESLFRARLRSVMMLIAMSIGVAAVVVLTSLGEGARRYVTGEFQALGTDLLIVLPGRSETTGVQPGLFAGETPRDLTLDDARALLSIPGVERIAPLVVGSAPVSSAGLTREVPVIGSTPTSTTCASCRWGRDGSCRPANSTATWPCAWSAPRWPPSCSATAGGRRVGAHRRPPLPRHRRAGDSGRAMGFDTQELVIIP
jgi:putative ABC transport system permease protein